MDINEEQLISFTYAPKDADASNLLLELSDGTLAKAEQTDDGIVLHTQAKEGTFTLVAKKGSAKSNELTFQVIDKEKAEQERIAAEKKAEEERLAAEKAEQERPRTPLRFTSPRPARNITITAPAMAAATPLLLWITLSKWG